MTTVTDFNPAVMVGVVVEDEVQFTLFELSRACPADSQQLVMWVAEGVLTPSGDDERSWRFDGSALRRARRALRLSRDFELNAVNTALVLELLDEIESLRLRLRRGGGD